MALRFFLHQENVTRNLEAGLIQTMKTVREPDMRGNYNSEHSLFLCERINSNFNIVICFIHIFFLQTFN